VGGIRCERLLVAGHRFFEPPQILQRDTAIVQDIGVLSIYREHLIVARKRLHKAPLLAQDITSVRIRSYVVENDG
jgi:hypothetical protein